MNIFSQSSWKIKREGHIKDYELEKGYVRCINDFILIQRNKRYLQYCLEEINKVCNEKLNLELNQKSKLDLHTMT